MGSVASLPESLGDAMDAFAKLLVAVERSVVQLAEHFPDLLKAFLSILENFTQLLEVIAKGSKFIVFALPAIAIFYVISYVIEELGL